MRGVGGKRRRSRDWGVEAMASGACAVGRRRWRWPGEAGGLLFICSWANSAAQAAAERGTPAAGPHEGALPPPCIVRKDPRVPHTA